MDTVIELPGGLRLARGSVDVGLLTNRSEAMLEFWSGELGLPVERSFEPVPGVTQHKLTMHGAVLKVNAVATPLPDRAPLGAIRLLRLVADGVEEPVHARDPDGNVVQLVPPGTGLQTFGVHLAVSDEPAAAHFYGHVLGLARTGERSFDVAGAELTFSWSPDVRPGHGGGGRGFGYLTLQVMDVVEAHELVCARGATEMQAPSDTAFAGGSSVSFVADPDGNTIEISQRPDLVAAAT